MLVPVPYIIVMNCIDEAKSYRHHLRRHSGAVASLVGNGLKKELVELIGRNSESFRSAVCSMNHCLHRFRLVLGVLPAWQGCVQCRQTIV